MRERWSTTSPLGSSRTSRLMAGNGFGFQAIESDLGAVGAAGERAAIEQVNAAYSENFLACGQSFRVTPCLGSTSFRV
jgi:hypothetical protein